MTRALLAAVCLLFAGLCAAADIGVVVMHGKWGTTKLVQPLSDALAREGYIVTTPEMPWSSRRLYDRTVEEANAELNALIADLEAKGAKRVFVIGHSLGAAFAVEYAAHAPAASVAGIVGVAPGHRPEAQRIADMMRADVKSARELVAAGKGGEIYSFTDFNTGGRRQRITSPAAAFLSYFDSEGPMNMARNVASVRNGLPVLWLVPTREESAGRDAGLNLYKRFPPNPDTQLGEPSSDHLGAPSASIAIITEWIRKVAGAGR